jgi:hypothetical protein
MTTQSLNTQAEYSDKYDNVVKCRIISFLKVNGDSCVKVKSYSKYGNHGIKTIDVDYFCNHYILN